MKVKVLHIWILTSLIWSLINFWAGVTIALATVVILIQDKQIEELIK